MKKLAIIGGGASGLAAAAAAAEELRAHASVLHDDVEICVFERDDRVGRSILATGNGRCNFSNIDPDASSYRNADFVQAVYSALEQVFPACANSGDSTLNAVLRFFARAGLVWREEAGGRLYPLANKASVVLDVLRSTMARCGVCECCNKELCRIDVPRSADERFHLRFRDGSIEHADALIYAAGARAVQRFLPEQLKVHPPSPCLGPLVTDGPVKALDNIRVKGCFSLKSPDGVCKASERGELLFRRYGVSGIAVFNLSRFACEGDRLEIDLLPQYSQEECAQLLVRRFEHLRSYGHDPAPLDLVRGMVLLQVAEVFMQDLGLASKSHCSAKDARALASVLKSFSLTVRGIGDVRQCQIVRGGVVPTEFDAKRMELLALPRLYLSGEACDVDGPCGGYNLHWAWASGILAGCAAARQLMGVAL